MGSPKSKGRLDSRTETDNFLTEEEHSLGSTIAWTVNWHHNAHQRKVVDGIWTDNDTSFIVVDARLGPEEGRMAHRSVKTDGTVSREAED